MAVGDALCVLRNLASGSDIRKAAIVEVGAIPPLVALLGGGVEAMSD